MDATSLRREKEDLVFGLVSPRLKTGEIRKKNPETNERYQNLDSSFTFGDLISPVFDRLGARVQREDDS